MKQMNAITWLITMLMALFVTQAFATDWGSENVTMQVGDTKTLYLPNSVTTKTLKSVTFYSASWNDVEVLSYTNYSVRVKALKATSIPVIVRCDYYYYISNGGYTYQNGGAYDFRVTVKGETTVKPTNISIPSTSSVKVGGSFYFVPSVTPVNAMYKLSWDSSNNSIASVNQSGMLTGISAGTATITVTTDNGKSAICKVTVTANSVTSVSIKSSLSLEFGDTYTLTPTITPSDAVTSYTWSTSDSSVATVSQSGVVTAKGTGTANVTVKTANGKTGTCAVNVSPKSVTSVSIMSSLSMEVGDTYTLTPTITPSDAVTSYTWSTSDSSVATVSQSGVVTVKGTGTANVTVKTANGKTATCAVNVAAKSVTSVSIMSSLSLEVGDTYILTPTITPSDAVTSYTWSSDDNSVVTVSQAGVVMANSVGSAKITVKTDNGKMATCEITVNAPAVVEYEVTFLIYGYENGQILYNGTKLSGSFIDDYGCLKVAEGSNVALSVLPNQGYKIDRLHLDFEDVMNELVDNILILHNVKKDLFLVVSFDKDDQSDGIVSIIPTKRQSGSESPIIVDLNGRRVDNSMAKKGVFIINGNKVFIK